MVPALKFGGHASAGGPARVEVRPIALADLKAQAADEGASAYVVRTGDLDHFRRLGDLVVDRKTKHERKELSALLIGQRRVPVIDGGYRSSGQLRRSVRRLLDRAADHGDKNVFVIGASPDLFDELWRDAAPVRSEPVSTTQAILDLIAARDVPEELPRRFIGTSLEAHLVRHLIMRAAELDDPVLIIGDTGTGKEIVARGVHEYSSRRFEAFVPVNCAAIPEDLLESELFGHEQGAFTGADYRKLGLWRAADRGTLFLDEIGDLRPYHQAKILRTLQDGMIRPVGAEKEVRVNARVLAATNRDLYAMVEAGRFREDLYYRLRSFFIPTPSLGRHPEDIPLLARAFWKAITRDRAATLADDVLAALSARQWPGNARELRAVLTHLHGLFGKTTIGRPHLDAVARLHAEFAGDRGRRGAGEAMERRESLRHLRKAAEVIRACEVAIAPFVSGRMKRSASALRSFKHRLGELGVVCLQPALFSSDVAYRAAVRVRNGLASMLDRLGGEPAEARRYWKEEIEPASALAMSAVLREIERLSK